MELAGPGNPFSARVRLCFGETVANQTERLIDTNGVTLRVTEAGDHNGPGAPVVLLAHGFPELAYSWRHQIPALADAGFHVLAPDQRGYGGSTRPEEIAAYDIAALTGDLVGLLDDVGAQRAVWIGHDWGGPVVWSAAQLHPERVAGVVGLSVPPVPRPQVAPTEAFGKIFGENFFYMLYFQQPGVADAELGSDTARTMRRMMGSLSPADRDSAVRMTAPGPAGFIERLAEPATRPDWISADELDHYIAEFTRTGFTGGINWYRNLDRNWMLTESVADTKVVMPALFVAGGADPVLMMSPPNMDEWVTDLRGSVILDGAGHWVQQERPDEVNAALLDFLADVSPTS